MAKATFTNLGGTMEKVLIAYWSGTGNTEAMAQAIANGIKNAGAECDVVNVSENPDVTSYDKIAFGCPAMGAENLEEGEFEPFFEDAESKISGKKVALFGSYGWGDGEWMQEWATRTTNAGANLFNNNLIINETPDDEGISNCEAFGETFAKF